MPRSLRLGVAILVLGLASVASHRWWSMSPEVATPVAAPAPPAPAVAVRPMPFATLVATPLPASRPMVNPTLAKGFATSTNYREFIAFAKTDIEHGGGAYASAAQWECGYVKIVLDTLKRDPPPAPEGSKDIVAIAEARTLLEARCGPLSDHELYPLVSQQLKKAGSDDLDPLLRIQKLVYEPPFKTDPEARRRFIALAIQTRDPMMWERYSSLIVSRDDAAETTYFDGVTYAGNDAIAMNAAVTLVPCGLGFDCARNDTIVAVTCLQLHICEHDRYALEKLKADYQQRDFLQVMRFHAALVAAVEANNVDAFIKP